MSCRLEKKETGERKAQLEKFKKWMFNNILAEVGKMGNKVKWNKYKVSFTKIKNTSSDIQLHKGNKNV
jgi:prophage antirepressor-like protein